MSEPTQAQVRIALSKSCEILSHVRSARELLTSISVMGLGVDAEGKTAAALLTALGESGDLLGELEEIEYEAGMTAMVDAENERGG